MASVKQFQVTFDCADPVRLAEFWAAAMGGRAEESSDGQSAAVRLPEPR